MNTHFQLYSNSRLNYLTCGKGEPLVLIHGYQADSQIWESLIPYLTDNFFLIIPDLPGHGKSPVIQSVNSMEFLSDFLREILISLKISEITIAGHSMGGYVALAFLKNSPNLVKRLILINSHPFEDSPKKISSRNQEAKYISQGKKELLVRTFVKNNFSKSSLKNKKRKIDRITEIALMQPEGGMLADLEGMKTRVNTEDELKNLKKEVDIILGDEDDKVQNHELQNFSCPNVSVHLINDCGHLSIIEKPEEISRIILKL